MLGEKLRCAASRVIVLRIELVPSLKVIRDLPYFLHQSVVETQTVRHIELFDKESNEAIGQVIPIEYGIEPSSTTKHIELLVVGLFCLSQDERLAAVRATNRQECLVRVRCGNNMDGLSDVFAKYD